MKFWKAHGCGNSFMIVDGGAYDEDWPLLARTCSDPMMSVGFDQLIVYKGQHVRFYNADGSEAEMCGNGLRCLAKLLMKGSAITLHAPAGPVKATKEKDELICIDMPCAQTELLDIKIRQDLLEDKPVFVNIGNPHLVCFVNNVDEIHDYGPILTNHHLFKKGVNVGFAKVIDRQHIDLRVWERGAGPTLACGSGATAAFVAGRLLGIVDDRITVTQKGGDLSVYYDGTQLRLKGPAVFVYKGELLY